MTLRTRRRHAPGRLLRLYAVDVRGASELTRRGQLAKAEALLSGARDRVFAALLQRYEWRDVARHAHRVERALANVRRRERE